MFDLEGLAVVGGALALTLGIAIVTVALGLFRWNGATARKTRGTTWLGLAAMIGVVVIVLGPSALPIAPILVLLPLGFWAIYKLLDRLFIGKPKPSLRQPRPVVEVEGFPVIEQPVILACEDRAYYLTPIEGEKER